MSRRTKIVLGIVIYVLVVSILRMLLPSESIILNWLQTAYQTYGYAIIFIFSLLEGIFVVGMFVPGTAIVIFGATLAGKGMMVLPFVIAAGVSGLLSGSMLSYWLGKVGWKRLLPKIPGASRMLQKVQDWHGEAWWITFVSFASTGIGSAITTGAGIVRVPFRKFVLFVLLAHLFWVSVWAITAYVFGIYVGNTIVAFAGVLAVILVIGILLQWYVRKKSK